MKFTFEGFMLYLVTTTDDRPPTAAGRKISISKLPAPCSQLFAIYEHRRLTADHRRIGDRNSGIPKLPAPCSLLFAVYDHRRLTADGRQTRDQNFGIPNSLLRAPCSLPLVFCIMRYTDHPADTEPVGDHTKTRRPESFRHWHQYLSALRQGGKFFVRFRFIGHRDGQRKTLEVGLSRAVAIRSHHARIADAKTDMHDFVFR